MLNGAHPQLGGQMAALGAVHMDGAVGVLAGGHVHRLLDLIGLHNQGPWLTGGHTEGTAAIELDKIRALLQVVTHLLAHLGGAVHLKVVRGAVGTVKSLLRGSQGGAGTEDPGPLQKPSIDLIPQGHGGVGDVVPHIPHGGVAVHQIVLGKPQLVQGHQAGLQGVGGPPHPHHPQVGVHVDEARHHRGALEIQGLHLPLHRGSAGGDGTDLLPVQQQVRLG